jgi:hypothetical protein
MVVSPLANRCRRQRALLVPLLLILFCVAARADDAIYASRRAAMIAEIEADIRYTSEQTGRQAFDHGHG